MERIAKLLAITACTGVALAIGTATAGEVKIIKAPMLDAKRVVKDKDTGKLRAATDEEIAEMGNAPTPSFAGNVAVISRPTTTMVTRPDGSATIRRSVEDLDSVVATRDANGKLVVRHAEGKQGAVK